MLTLQELRKRAGYTQFEVAVKTGYSLNMIAKIESGSRNPGPTLVARLAKLYKVNEHDIREAVKHH
jgi:transcriptional regulator with XRE-family HTH domain